MKLQLLLVLALAALVPSLSEGRIFSKCELKSMFEKAITLRGRMQKHKEELLATIICQLNQTSGLNSNLVIVEGNRKFTTTALPSTLVLTGNPVGPAKPTTSLGTNSTGANSTGTTSAGANSTGTNSTGTNSTGTNSTGTTSAGTTSAGTNSTGTNSTGTNSTGTNSTGTNSTGTNSTRANSTGTNSTGTNSTGTINTPTTTTPTNTTASNVTIAGPASPSPSAPSGKIRRKRSSPRRGEKKEKHSKSDEESMFDLEMECDMSDVEEDNDMKKRKEEDLDSSEEDQQTTVWSLARYGLFQLTDGHFCDSGYRWSRNVCHTDCSAFTDDDISDDIDCFIESKYLGCFLEPTPQFCLDQAETYFSDCS